MVIKLKNIPAEQWNEVEINWGNGDIISWLQQLAKSIEKESKLIRFCEGDGEEFEFVSTDEREKLNEWQNGYEIKVNEYKKKTTQKTIKLDDYDENLHTLISNRWRLSNNDYLTQNIYEDIAFMLWGGENNSKIFYRQLGKIGTIKSQEAFEYLQNVAGNLEVRGYERQEQEVQRVRNILLIGRTGQGKSTLANVLINEDESFKEVFKEGNYSVSETKDIQAEVFENNGIKYQIVDTIGLDDTELKLRQVIRIIFKACKKVENGLSQVFFVIGEKFTDEEVEAYKILRKVLFDEGVVKYTTIVRTNFSNFETEEQCEKDIKLLIEGKNEAVVEMIESCNKKVIHVNNPPVNISGSGRTIEAQNSLNKEIREESRKKILEYLEKNCGRTYYKPENLDKINKKIDEFAMEEVENLQKALNDKKGELEKEKNLENKKLIEIEIKKIEKKIKEREELMERKMSAFIEILERISRCEIM